MPDDARALGAPSAVAVDDATEIPLREDRPKPFDRLAFWRPFSQVKVSFRTGMIGLSLVFVAAGALSAHIPWLWVSQENVGDLSRDINGAVITGTDHEIQDLFRSVANQAQGLAGMIDAGVLDPSDPAKLEQAELALLRANDEFSFVTLGLPNGSGIDAQRINDHELSVGQTTWDASRGVGSRTEKHYALTQDGLFYTRDVQSQDGVDFTQRPWYVGAAKTPGKPFASKVSVLVSGKPGVSVGVADEHDGKLAGVISISIDLSRLSTYLAELDLGKDSASFIIGRDGTLVAFSDQRESLTGADGNLKSIAASFHPKLMLANQAIEAGKVNLGAINAPIELSASDADGTYFVTIAPDGRRDWLVGTVIPESNFLGAIEKNRERLVFIGLGALVLVGVLAAWVARDLFVRPLVSMIDETHHIERFDLEAVQPVSSAIHELHDLSSALVRMARGLGSFRRFLPADLVQELMRQGVTAEVGGQRRTLTVLFMDVANFTTLTERMGHRILPLLGDYLSDMTGVLMHHHATIDKFIGDAVMAIWGAPHINEEHPADACRAALECAARMEERRREWAAEKKPQMHIRIGINTGRMVVGNIGSRDRLNYTVIGDAVNLASRLEGLNKVYGTGIIIGAATYELAKYDIIARRLDHVNVKGKEENVAVYELLGMADEEGQAPPPWVAIYERALDLYYGGDIAGARQGFAETLKMRPDDTPSQHFLQLCGERLVKVA